MAQRAFLHIRESHCYSCFVFLNALYHPIEPIERSLFANPNMGKQFYFVNVDQYVNKVGRDKAKINLKMSILIGK